MPALRRSFGARGTFGPCGPSQNKPTAFLGHRSPGHERANMELGKTAPTLFTTWPANSVMGTGSWIFKYTLVCVRPVPKCNFWELLWQHLYRLIPIPAIQPTVLKHRRMTEFLTWDSILPPAANIGSGTLWWLHGLQLPCLPASRAHPFCDHNSVPDLETACCHHTVTASQEHCYGSIFYRPDVHPAISAVVVASGVCG